VEDVFGEVVFSTRDEDLCSSEFVSSIGLRDGLGLDLTKIRTALGFCQTHGTAPSTFSHLGDINLERRDG